MSTRGNGASLIGCGFSSAESWGRWTKGKRATIILDIPPQAWASSWQMEVTTSAFVAPAHSTLTVEVHVNGEKIIEWKFADWRQQKRVVTIPSDLLKKDKKLVLIEFNILDPISPKALGMSQDSRELGLGVSKLTFSQLSESAAERTRETQ